MPKPHQKSMALALFFIYNENEIIMKFLISSRLALRIAAISAAGGAIYAAPTSLVASAQAAPKVPASLLVTTKSIGSARLGRSVATMKKAFPGSIVTVPTDGPAEFYTLKKNGRDLIYFVTRESATGDSGKIRYDDTVISMWTSDPHFKTSRGIGPGSWLHNAVAVYGKPKISFNPHEESGIFPAYSDKLWFEPEAPQDPNSEVRVAGIYTAQELENLDGTTTRFKRGTRITSIGCWEKYYE